MTLTNRQDVELRELILKVARENRLNVDGYRAITGPMRDVALIACALITLYKGGYAPPEAVKLMQELELDDNALRAGMDLANWAVLTLGSLDLL